MDPFSVAVFPGGQVIGFYRDLVRAPVAAFAAHGSAAPDQLGTALFALWQAFYHQVGQWHAVGGSQALTDALARRLASSGGDWRTGAPAAAIRRGSAGVSGVMLESGEMIPARTVVTAIDPRTALLGLLDPPLAGPPAAALAAAHHGNAVQMLVLIATRRLPPYPGAQPMDYRGLQSYVDSLASLSGAFAQAGAGRLPRDPIPAYAFTPSACDPSLAPDGRHTVYLACPAAPAHLEGGWEPVKEAFADRLIAAVEARAPGFADSVLDRVIRTPEDMTRELRWPGAHPMHLDVTLDQVGPFRPTAALGSHRTPVPGLYVSGAGTAPLGGISGAPGRAAAAAVLRDQRRRRR
jgi:phytoene dehydrogenase-like protein